MVSVNGFRHSNLVLGEIISVFKANTVVIAPAIPHITVCPTLGLSDPTNKCLLLIN